MSKATGAEFLIVRERAKPGLGASDFCGTPSFNSIIPRRPVTSVVAGPSAKPRILRRYSGGGETSDGRAISNRYHPRYRGDVR